MRQHDLDTLALHPGYHPGALMPSDLDPTTFLARKLASLAIDLMPSNQYGFIVLVIKAEKDQPPSASFASSLSRSQAIHLLEDWIAAQKQQE